MKPSTTVKSSPTKSKKSSKDREKRKSQTAIEANNQHTPDKSSPSKDPNVRKYAGLSPDSLLIYAEQSSFAHLTDEVCNGLTEDLNYKLRQIIHDSLIKARLSSRNYISSSDIEATFDNLNINKVYGATSTPNWITFGDQGFSYLDDPKVNLIQIAEQECSHIQPAETVMIRKWLPDVKEISKPLKTYFTTMCEAVVGRDKDERLMALNDISENTRIGPIIEWFYHFGYFLLSKDITYDCLTLYALDLIEALEKSAIATQIVSEKQLKLLVRLILQRLLRSVTTIEVLKPMCTVLSVLCLRYPIKDFVITKIKQKLPEIKDDFALPIISIISSLGIEAISDIFIPNMEFFLQSVEENKQSELLNVILNIFRVYFTASTSSEKFAAIHDSFYEKFGDALIPNLKAHGISCNVPEELEKNEMNMRIQLMKTRRRIPYDTSNKSKVHIEEAIPESDDDIDKKFFESGFDTMMESGCDTKPVICFKFHSFAPATGRLRFLKMAKYSSDQINPETNVMIGKRTLLCSDLNKLTKRFQSTCIDHTLLSYNF